MSAQSAGLGEHGNASDILEITLQGMVKSQIWNCIVVDGRNDDSLSGFFFFEVITEHSRAR